MPLPKPLSKAMIRTAMDKTKSNMAAARYLHCSYQHYKKWAKKYVDEDSGKTLFDLHKNQQGKGIPKFLKHSKKEPVLLDIIEGRVSPASFNPDKLRYRMIQEGYLAEECAVCGFNERRVMDYKIPLLLNFKDKNTNNYFLNNVELLCYNCYFLRIGDVFNAKDIEQLETGKEKFETSNNIEFEVDEYTRKRFIELGLEEDTEDDFSDLISRQ